MKIAAIHSQVSRDPYSKPHHGLVSITLVIFLWRWISAEQYSSVSGTLIFLLNIKHVHIPFFSFKKNVCQSQLKEFTRALCWCVQAPALWDLPGVCAWLLRHGQERWSSGRAAGSCSALLCHLAEVWATLPHCLCHLHHHTPHQEDPMLVSAAVRPLGALLVVLLFSLQVILHISHILPFKGCGVVWQKCLTQSLSLRTGGRNVPTSNRRQKAALLECGSCRYQVKMALPC